MGCLSVVQQLTGLRYFPLSYSWGGTQTKKRVWVPVVNSVAISNAETKDRLKLKQLFREAYERCITAPMDGVSFTLQDFTAALDKYDFDSQVVGTKVKGTVFCTDANDALVDITAKSSAYLPLQEACIHRVNHVEEAGIVAGLREEFLIIGENEEDDSLILSLRSVQHDLAWERCRQLQSYDVVVKGKVGLLLPTINFISRFCIKLVHFKNQNDMNFISSYPLSS